MEPKQRDRIAFHARCSGQAQGGDVRAKLVERARRSRVGAAIFCASGSLAGRGGVRRRRVGIPNHGILRIGDYAVEGEEIVFAGAELAPEILRRVQACDA